MLLFCFLLCSFSQPAAQVQAVFFGPMQPVPLSDFSALLLSLLPYHRKNVWFNIRYHRKSVYFSCSYHRKSVSLQQKYLNFSKLWKDRYTKGYVDQEWMENIPIIAIGTYFEKWYVKDYAAFLSERNKLKIVLSVSTDWKAVRKNCRTYSKRIAARLIVYTRKYHTSYYILYII